MNTFRNLIFCLILMINFQLKAQLPGFGITGNPESQTGAKWTYRQSVSGIDYDLQGILYKPSGTRRFPAVIINHGTGGSSNTYSKSIAIKMREWGFVCIATNYTHSSGVPCGLPGECKLAEYGAAENNQLRGMKCRNILASLSYVDTTQIVTFGHSRGAFLTTGLAASHPGKFRAAAHTAGGVIPGQSSVIPNFADANQLRIPYLIHHGTSDNTVPLSYDQDLDSILTSNKIDHQFYIYPNYTHSQMSMDSLMFARTRTFFSKYVNLLPEEGVVPPDDDKLGGSLFKGKAGVYYLGSADVPVADNKYSNPNISGVVCRFKWESVEPSPGVFNWAFVDGEILKARNANKKISLQPLGIPIWMNALPNVEVYHYIDKNQFHSTYNQVLDDVIPWGDLYLEKLKNLIQEMALKYAGDTVVS